MKKLFNIIVAALLATIAMSAVAGDCYSDGIRVGSIQKFSQKGFVNKSWEGELVMEGMKIRSGKSGVRGGDVWKFSVTDPSVAKTIDEAVMSGGEIALRYCQANPLDPTTHLITETPYRITQAVLRKG